MRCDAMRCDAMRCDAMRCDAMRGDACTFCFDCLSIDRSINLVSHPLVIRFTKGEQAIYMRSC